MKPGRYLLKITFYYLPADDTNGYNSKNKKYLYPGDEIHVRRLVLSFGKYDLYFLDNENKNCVIPNISKDSVIYFKKMLVHYGKIWRSLC